MQNWLFLNFSGTLLLHYAHNHKCVKLLNYCTKNRAIASWQKHCWWPTNEVFFALFYVMAPKSWKAGVSFQSFFFLVWFSVCSEVRYIHNITHIICKVTPFKVFAMQCCYFKARLRLELLFMSMSTNMKDINETPRTIQMEQWTFDCTSKITRSFGLPWWCGLLWLAYRHPIIGSGFKWFWWMEPLPLSGINCCRMFCYSSLLQFPF